MGVYRLEIRSKIRIGLMAIEALERERKKDTEGEREREIYRERVYRER